MKKNNILYLIFAIVVVVSILVYINNSKTTLKKELRDFAFRDTASINKIFLADKKNNTILLERIAPARWMVNKKFIARQDAINLLLDAIASIEVKAPVPKSAFENVTKILASRSIKTEIYANNNLVKTYYVGPATPDNLGTYMILENSSVPFITYKPGFNGYLTVRYIMDEIEWRDLSLFPISITNVYSISYFFPQNVDASFTIVRKSSKDYELHDFKENKISYFDTLKIKEHAILTLKAKIDQWAFFIPKHRIDSLKKTVPIAQIKIKNINGDIYKLDLYRMLNINKYVDEKGQPMTFDPDILYGFYNDSIPTLCQYFVFDPIMRPLSDFIIKDMAKK